MLQLLLSNSASIFPIFLLALLCLVLLYLLIYQQIIKPLQIMQFYKKQGINCEFIPFSGSSPQDSINVTTKGDYYYGWLDKSIGKGKGKLFCKNIGSVVALILTDSDLIKQMFINKDDFIKHQFQNALVRRLSPFGLVLTEGSIWKKHRLLISKGFQYNVIDSQMMKIHSISEKLVQKMVINNTKQIINAFNFFKEIAGNIISLIYFQENILQIQIDGKSMPIYLSDLIAQLTGQSYNWKYCIFGMNLIDLQIFETHRYLLQKIRKMREAVRKIVLRHTSQNQKKQSFNMWDIFLNKGSQVEGLTTQQMIDQFITFFSDGVYTTGHFMMMMTYNLAKHPQWKKKLRKQLKENVYNSENLSQSLLNKLPILSACTKQTLRIMPPVVTGIERIANKDTQLSDGTKVIRNTMVMACHLSNHLNPAFHDDASVFNPERWLNPQSKTMKSVKQHPGSFIPFSIGQRRCPGQKFAMAEAAIFLTEFLYHFDYNIMNQQKYELKFTQRFLREPLNQFGYNITKINQI